MLLSRSRIFLAVFVETKLAVYKQTTDISSRVCRDQNQVFFQLCLK